MRPTAVQALAFGETLTDTVTVTLGDGVTTQDIVITIHGTNDIASVVGSTVGGNVSEDAVLIASGTLVINDVDTSDNPSFPDLGPTAGTGGYGTFEITGSIWTYRLDNASAQVQGLYDGESVSDSYTFVATDGTPLTVFIFLTGTNDGATIAGDGVGAVTRMLRHRP